MIEVLRAFDLPEDIVHAIKTLVYSNAETRLTYPHATRPLSLFGLRTFRQTAHTHSHSHRAGRVERGGAATSIYT